MRIAVVANSSWYLWNFRRSLMQQLVNAGHQVLAVGPRDGYEQRLTAEGFHHRRFSLKGSSINPLSEAQSLWNLRRILAEERIEVALSYTPKGNIYAALASGRGVALVPNVSGLGRAFVRQTPLTLVVKGLYRIAFAKAHRVLFQNADDLETFLRWGLVHDHKAERILGSGIDLSRFEVPIKSNTQSSFVFLLMARMLWDKGVEQYVEAARRLRQQCKNTEFHLLGFIDPQHPSGISKQQLDAWNKEGAIRYLGSTDDVTPYLRDADCVVLPSFYREGVPRTMLEGAAMGKPLITTDTPGCRDTVDDGVTGFLCKPRDVSDLAEKMMKVLQMDPAERQAMGQRGREKMEREFDERLVIKRYLEIVSMIAATRQRDF